MIMAPGPAQRTKPVPANSANNFSVLEWLVHVVKW